MPVRPPVEPMLGVAKHAGLPYLPGKRVMLKVKPERTADCVVAGEGHPWEHGYGLEGGAMGRLPGAASRWTPDMERDWTPLAPTAVVEVRYDRVEGVRFRHPPQFKRWRPDRDARSCTLDRLAADR